MTENNQVHFFGAIEKFDAAADGSLMVSGIASTEAVDADGEIITADAMREAIKGYMELTPLGFPKGTIREMHGAKAVGCPVSVSVDEKGNTRLTAHIVDKSAVEKITAGVLKGFSLAGKTLKKTGNKINSLLLKDFSLVDIPNN